jgi:diaminopimelate decarboxylase
MLEYLHLSRPHLVMGGVDLVDLAEREGTPLYVYDADVVRKKRAMLAGALGDIDLFYSIKANPCLAVTEILAAEGCGAEVASLGEIVIARRAGIDPSDIVFAGPAKTERETEQALRARIYALNVESPVEMDRVNAAAAGLGTTARALIRVNLTKTDESWDIRVTGASKFGVDEDRAGAAYVGREWPHVDIAGVHVFSGGQNLNADSVLATVRHIAALAEALADGIGFELRAIDFGGGLGVPYNPDERELDIGRLGQGLAELQKELRGHHRGIRLIWESGRYLVAESGVYIARVVDVKESGGKTFVLVDGGLHHLLRTALLRINHPTLLANKLDREPSRIYTVGGPICNMIDILARDVELPEVEVGDLVAVANAGAYCRSMSPEGFLSHPSAPEWIVTAGSAHLARPAGTDDDALQGQRSLRDELRGAD